MSIVRLASTATGLLVLTAAACGDSGTGLPSLESGTRVTLTSEAGDYVGGGRSYEYTLETAVIEVTADGGLLRVRVRGDEDWQGDFQMPAGSPRLEVGMYGELQRYPFHDPSKGGLDWAGDGRGCNTLTGWFEVDEVAYDGDVLSAITVRFAQHCEGAAAALRGSVHWWADDPTIPPGPVVPAPLHLWEPPSAVVERSGPYVYLESGPGDYVGGGITYLYSPADATITVTAQEGHARVAVDSDTWWSGDFQAMAGLSRLEVGYYPDLRRYPFHNPAKGGLAWFGDGRGCNELTGWFAIDDIAYSGDRLTAITLRFAQWCDARGGGLHGAIRWQG